MKRPLTEHEKSLITDIGLAIRAAWLKYRSDHVKVFVSPDTECDLTLCPSRIVFHPFDGGPMRVFGYEVAVDASVERFDVRYDEQATTMRAVNVDANESD